MNSADMKTPTGKKYAEHLRDAVEALRLLEHAPGCEFSQTHACTCGLHTVSQNVAAVYHDMLKSIQRDDYDWAVRLENAYGTRTAMVDMIPVMEAVAVAVEPFEYRVRGYGSWAEIRRAAHDENQMAQRTLSRELAEKGV